VDHVMIFLSGKVGEFVSGGKWLSCFNVLDCSLSLLYNVHMALSVNIIEIVEISYSMLTYAGRSTRCHYDRLLVREYS